MTTEYLTAEYIRQRDLHMNHDVIKRVIFDQYQVIIDMAIVNRDIVLEKDANYVLVGLRRAGKTTLLCKRVQDLINEGVEWNQIIDIYFGDERLLVFHDNGFDEIQNVDGCAPNHNQRATKKQK